MHRPQFGLADVVNQRRFIYDQCRKGVCALRRDTALQSCWLRNATRVLPRRSSETAALGGGFPMNLELNNPSAFHALRVSSQTRARNVVDKALAVPAPKQRASRAELEKIGSEIV